ncbi:MAG: sigma 54-interacting transcriptional regulator [Parvularculaceae bacterium]
MGSSPAIKRLRDLIELFGPFEDPVLICGETGVGKEAVAQGVHAASRRAGAPLVVHNAGRVDRELTGSQFFGHVRGAFTGAAADRTGLFADAHGGALHLDEIGDLPFALQANFLRVLEDGLVTPVGANAPVAVDVRVIAATNCDLRRAVEEGAFRRDLYYRLNVLRIDVPPLRARGEDVVEIAEHFVAERGQSFSLSPKAADKLKTHAWPGNVRELKNCVTRAAVLARGGDIDPEHIEFDGETTGVAASLDIDAGKRAIALYLAAIALERAGGNVSKAATLANMNRTSFHALKKELDGVSPAALRDGLSAFVGGAG